MAIVKTKTIHPLTRWRFRNGQMSLAALGKLVDASAPHLSDIENGMKNPSIELLARLAKETKLPARRLSPTVWRATVRAAERLDMPRA